MLGSSALVAFVGVCDLDRAERFYAGALGLTLRDERPFALVAECTGGTLRITATDRRVAAPYTVAGWQVTDLRVAMDELASRGVVFSRFEGMDQDERGVWAAPSGARVAWFLDPEGNLLSLTQPTPDA